MKLHWMGTAVALLSIAACGPNETVADNEKGQVGSSSGPNPNLSDLQTKTRPDQTTTPADPATPAENTYPSQTGDPGAATTGAEGGRGSAQTGASDDGA
jgi:hypothetical protein